MENSLINNYTL